MFILNEKSMLVAVLSSLFRVMIAIDGVRWYQVLDSRLLKGYNAIWLNIGP